MQVWTYIYKLAIQLSYNVTHNFDGVIFLN